MTEQQIFEKLSALCARSEHCTCDMLKKMQQWGADEELQAAVMARLTAERYVDDERFARAFVREKLQYNKWGRRKIEQALWGKHIDAEIRNSVMADISDHDYLGVLRPLLRQKAKTIRAANSYDHTQKLIRFALSRGFTFDLIRQCLDVGETDVDSLAENNDEMLGGLED